MVRSFAESFTSLMNYAGDDYVLGHIVQLAWLTSATEFCVDLLHGRVEPSPLLVSPVAESVGAYIKRFPDLVVRSNSGMDFVASAEMVATVDPMQRIAHRRGDLFSSPTSCTVRIVDNRGKAYSHTVSQWWYPEHPPRTGLLDRLRYAVGYRTSASRGRR